jgi:hypothetical protein
VLRAGIGDKGAAWVGVLQGCAGVDLEIDIALEKNLV